MDDEFPIVAAIDFGTANSGYAFGFRSECTASQVGKVYCSTWTSGVGARSSSVKVPTTVLFDKEMKCHSFGFEAEEDYAKLTEKKQHKDWHYFRRFKLKLYGEKKLSREYTIQDELGGSFPAQTVFSAAMKYLKNVVIDRIKLENPMTSKNSDEDYDHLIKWILTIPAIWNEPAKQFMREAAMEAGIPGNYLTFALEPEAAAVFCKHLTQSSQKDSKDEDIISAFSEGGRYMIIDLGGGTADIAVHQVSRDESLTEVVAASGGPWGGTHVNKSFFDYIDEQFGEEEVKHYSESHVYDWLQLDHEFEEQKKRLLFEDQEDDVFRITLPVRMVLESSKQLDMQSYNKLRLFVRQLKDFYDKSVDNIVPHVSKIIEEVKDLNLILMVGGFSNSEYVLQRMKNAFPDKRIIRPLRAETAVLEGAVMFGFFPCSISSRICRTNYGMRVMHRFVEGQHPIELRKKTGGIDVATDQFELIVKKGELLEINQKKEITSLASVHKTDGEKQSDTRVTIFSSTVTDPMSTKEKCCSPLGQIVIHPPEFGWPDYVRYRVELFFGRTEFEVKVYNDADNVEYKATYDFLEV